MTNTNRTETRKDGTTYTLISASFGAADKRGEIGCVRKVYACNGSYEFGEGGWCMVGYATRNGEKFGAVHSTYFASEAEALEAARKSMDAAAKRATK